MEVIKPNLRHKRAFKEVVNGSTITSAMRKVGYAESSVQRTNKLTGTKGWQKLVDKYISDTKLAKVHSEGLQATKYETILTGKGESEITEVPDFGVRHKYLESGYKIKGRYSNEEGGNKVLIINISEASAQRYATTFNAGHSS